MPSEPVLRLAAPESRWVAPESQMGVQESRWESASRSTLLLVLLWRSPSAGPALRWEGLRSALGGWWEWELRKARDLESAREWRLPALGSQLVPGWRSAPAWPWEPELRSGQELPY